MRTVKTAEDRREEILNGALKLFLERGFGTTSIDRIVAELHVSKGLVFYHFGSKEELVAAVVGRIADRVAAPAVRMLETEAEFSDKIAQALRYFLAFSLEYKMRFHDFVDGSSLRVLNQIQEAVFRRIEPSLRRMVSDGIARGETDNPYAVESLAILVLGGIAYMDLHSSSDGFDRAGFVRSMAVSAERTLGMRPGLIVSRITDAMEKEPTT